MGASQSTNDKEKPASKNLSDVINYLASNYILEQNFQDMVNLRDAKYCNDLVILTSDVIGEYLNNQQVKYLSQRTREGAVVNEIAEDQLLWVKEKDFKNLDVRNKVPKKRLCIGIAKYYVKIAHLFGAIVTTVNPTYTYKENITGKKITVSLQNKKLIPSYATPKLNRINICTERINALINGKDFTSGENVVIQPNFCNMNNRKDGNDIKSLSDEPGIPELELLYKDIYDYDEGKFKSMSTKMKEKYGKDVELFYKTFTGNNNKPDTVNRFSDIKLRDFASSEGCKPGSVYTEKYEGTIGQELFKKYAEHIKKMIENAQNNQNALLTILDKMFAWNRNHQDLTKQIIISPELNEAKLDELIAEARTLIIKCYTTCESDFIAGLEIFEAIVEKQIMDVTKSQIEKLEETISSTLAEGPTSEKADEPPKEESEPDAATKVEENPVEENPVQENPVQENPVQENQVQENPVEEKPVQESTETTNEHVTETFINKPEQKPVEKQNVEDSNALAGERFRQEGIIDHDDNVLIEEKEDEPVVPTDSTTIVNTESLLEK